MNIIDILNLTDNVCNTKHIAFDWTYLDFQTVFGHKYWTFSTLQEQYLYAVYTGFVQVKWTLINPNVTTKRK